jgi:hypothetical protein
LILTNSVIAKNCRLHIDLFYETAVISEKLSTVIVITNYVHIVRYHEPPPHDEDKNCGSGGRGYAMTFVLMMSQVTVTNTRLISTTIRKMA